MKMHDGVQQRRNRLVDQGKYVPGPDYDHSRPYGGKVALRRRIASESRCRIAFKISVLSLAIWLLYFAYCHPAKLTFYTVWIPALMGHSEAQHLLGQKYLHGHGDVPQDQDAALYWFRKSAEQGHPHSSYNLAVAHLKGYDVAVKHSEVRQIIKDAAIRGVPEAKAAMKHLCPQEHSDCNYDNEELTMTSQ